MHACLAVMILACIKFWGAEFLQCSYIRHVYRFFCSIPLFISLSLRAMALVWVSSTINYQVPTGDHLPEAPPQTLPSKGETEALCSISRAIPLSLANPVASGVNRDLPLKVEISTETSFIKDVVDLHSGGGVALG